MTFPRVRIRVRDLMVCVAVVAAALGVEQWYKEWHWAWYAPDTGFLSTGQRAYVIGEVTSPDGSTIVRAGTPCLVRLDDVGDEDDCYGGDRHVEVKLTGGNQRGQVVLVERGLLRKR